MDYTFKQYKNDLIDYYKYPYDKDKKEERRKIIDSLGDEYLYSLYNNSINMCKIILKKMKEENSRFNSVIFTQIELTDDYQEINTNCIGGWVPDCLYKAKNLDNDNYFSLLILNKVLTNFMIYEDVINEYYEDDDIGINYYYPIFCISSKADNFNDIYNKYIIKDKIRSYHENRK